jgi:hypothetical protein
MPGIFNERRIKDADGRRCARVFFDFDQSGLRTRTLRQLRSSFVERQHIGIAMLVQAARCSRLLRVVPCAGRNLHHARSQVVADHCSSENGAPFVVHSHHVAVANAAAGGVGLTDSDRLTASHFALLAQAAHIHLAVKARCWLSCEKMQRIAEPFGAAQPFRWFKPGRMAQTIVVAKARDLR